MKNTTDSPEVLATAPCSPPLVSALFVEAGGCYDVPSVDAWPEQRDARLYRGPRPVVAHPPCQRWGRFWHGSTRKPHQFRLGEDSGCFAAALTSVRNYGGVLEHPAGSLAWSYFGLRKPKQGAGWVPADAFGGWTCQVDQRHYGHEAPKPTWLYAVRTDRPELMWEKSDRTPPAWMIERYGERKARKIGVVAMIGGKDKTRIRNATPLPFRDLLLAIASSANASALAQQDK
ncbi:MAG: hypothetical protein EBV03_08785 [Proteobacteria bacterium]|nr:hypothetical protein [Pseudomonadota bacterium]